MPVSEQGEIQIHTENIFPIIKKAVYSDHEIFLRELISNGLDAINKRRMASMAGDCSECESAKINITIDRETKQIVISDNGIGMSANEVKKYINQVAFSSAEEFLQKYKKDSDEIIGHFGLGFYSSFMVSKQVEIKTLSAIENANAVHWKCDGSPKFTLEECDKEEIGTDIILHLLEEEEEFIEPTRIRTLITKYCDFMPIEICLNGEVVNKQNPLWRQNPKNIEDKKYIELYNYLYPFQGDPLLWVHLNTDYPYNLQGILYFPRTTGRADWEKGEIRLFCNQVFVSDSIKEVVPRFLVPLRGVIDSPDIPLNVSRSALQTDRKVRSIGNFIAKKVADKLMSIKKEDPNRYAELWDSVSPYIKIGAMEDQKFADQTKDLVLFQTTALSENGEKDSLGLIKGNEKTFTTIGDYITRLADSEQKRIIYCTDPIAQATALNLWKSQGSEVLTADTVIDSQFIPWLEDQQKDLKFQRVDSEIDTKLKSDEPEISDKGGETSSEQLRTLLKDALANEKITIQVQALKGNDSPPAIILLPEQMRRINDIGALMEQRLPGLPENHVLLINRSHPLVNALLKLKAGSVIVGSTGSSPTERLSKDLARHIYDMAKLGVGGLEPNEVANFQERTATVMSQLLEKAL
ncbi:molecular chaperone HtpG [Prochlorococcus sp. MIT 1300]|uniref:molecular chaperone HtpG n=1 Tax=Prochlorococcus sp. MIT 1300 TaxID=3096218 RepID=UPI002A74794D|nr:molecular chaperone HtpG [Prochlorococcus sp. MIT 1300]